MRSSKQTLIRIKAFNRDLGYGENFWKPYANGGVIVAGTFPGALAPFVSQRLRILLPFPLWGSSPQNSRMKRAQIRDDLSVSVPAGYIAYHNNPHGPFQLVFVFVFVDLDKIKDTAPLALLAVDYRLWVT